MGSPMRYQPQGAVRLSRTRTVFFAWAGSGADVVSGAQGIRTGANAPVPAFTRSGRGHAFSGAPAKTGYLNFGNGAGVNALFGSPTTLIFELYPTDFAATYAVASKSDNNNNSGWDLSQNTSGGVSLTIIGASGNYRASSSGPMLITGQRNTVILVFGGDSTSGITPPVTFYINGQNAGSPAAHASGPQSDAVQPLLIGARTYNENSNLDYKGSISLVAFVLGAASGSDAVSLHANPWQLCESASNGSAYQASIATAAPASSWRTGTLSSTLGAASMAAGGAIKAAGTSAASLGSLAITASGVANDAGALSATLSGVVLAALGAATAPASLASTLSAATLTSASSATVAGGASVMLGPAVLMAATGTAAPADSQPAASSGALGAQLSSITLSATGAAWGNGQAGITLGALQASATGFAPVTGQTNAALGALSLSAYGGLPVTAGLQGSLGELTLEATAGMFAFTRSQVRTYCIAPENRRYKIAAENRTYRIEP